MNGNAEVTITLSEVENDMSYDFSEISNVELINADLDSMNIEQLSVFYQQTCEEYFADVANGSLRYFTIGIGSPAVEVSGTYYYEKRSGSRIAVNRFE